MSTASPILTIDDPTAAFLAECCPLPGSARLDRWPGLARPFRVGWWIFATDCAIAARLHVELAPPELVAAVGPPEGTIPGRCVEETDFLLNAFDRRRSAVSVPGCGPWLIDCRDCKGTGTFRIEGSACQPAESVCCGGCEGLGKVPHYDPVILAESPGHAPYRFTCFVADRLRRADAAVYLPETWPGPGAEGEPERGRFAAAWVAADGCEGLAMPMRAEG